MPLRNQNLRNNMVLSQLRPHKITNKKILSAMGFFDREDFFPNHQKAYAYVDSHVLFKKNRHFLSALTVAKILEAADIKEGETVLILGSGTGYLAFLASYLTNQNVLGIENDQDFMVIAEKNLTKYESPQLTFVRGDYLNDQSILEGLQFDVVLCDIGMRTLNGIDALLKDQGRFVGVQLNFPDEGALLSASYPCSIVKGQKAMDRFETWNVGSTHVPSVEARSSANKFVFQ